MRLETSQIKTHQGTRLVSAKGAADRLGLSVWTVYAWARAGRIPTVRLGARRLFVQEDLDRLIATNRTPERLAHQAAGIGATRPPDGLQRQHPRRHARRVGAARLCGRPKVDGLDRRGSKKDRPKH